MYAALDVRPQSANLDRKLRETLQLFGYKSLKPEQEELIDASIDGQDILGILPTGYGKSACFQIPGVVAGAKTLVISPLIALQEDQVRKLRSMGVKAFCMHSNLTDARKAAAHYYFKNAPHGEPSFLYLSPELLLTETFNDRFGGVRFDRLAVDEAHCVSTWGDAFRPDYQRIRVAVQRLRIPQCSAFTATVDSKIERDIRRRIPLRTNHLRVMADPFRPNLQLAVSRPAHVDDHEKLIARRLFSRMLHLLADETYAGPTIVYCGTRNATFELWYRMRVDEHRFCTRYGYTPYLFHAGLPYEDKEAALDGFLKDVRPIIFATTAFGMGIDRADVRQVIHYQVPSTLIDYAQQVGRAGRDGLTSLCTAFHLRGDTFDARIKKFSWDLPTYDFVEMVHRRLRQVYERRPLKQGRRYNLQTFANYMQAVAKTGGKIRRVEQYVSRVKASLALLQRVGIVVENGDGLFVSDIIPGSKPHLDLIALTEMEMRKLVREAGRLVHFFDSDNPDQRLLWDILQSDKVPEPHPEETEKE